MAISTTLTRTFSYGGSTITQNDTISSGAVTFLDETITGGSTDTLVALVMDVSQMTFLYIASTRDMTLEFNSNAGSGGTINLKADKAVMWSTNCGLTNPMGTDVTALYVTLASGADATLQARFGYDPTV